MLTSIECDRDEQVEPEAVFKCTRCGQKWRSTDKERARKAYQEHALGDETCDLNTKPQDKRV